MMARRHFVFASLALIACSGCCCFGPQVACQSPGCGAVCDSGACHSMGGGKGLLDGGLCCGVCWPQPIVWCGTQNECGPHGCEGCACPNDCGILPLMRWNKTCGSGCSDIYWGEWISDPPDCCDPCDQCFGQFTGPHGYCRLGPMQHLLAAFHGYKYCPKPCCDEGCGGLCGRRGGMVCGACGGAGCDTCGAEHITHGAVHQTAPGEVYYEPGPGGSIMNENWDRPAGPKPVPGKPIHKAQQPGPLKVGQAQPAGPTYGRMVKTAANWGR